MTPTDPLILATATAVDAALESVRAFLDPDGMPDDTTTEEINIGMMVSQTLALAAIGRALLTIATLMPARECGAINTSSPAADIAPIYHDGFDASDYPCVRRVGHDGLHRDYTGDTYRNTSKTGTA